MTQQSLQMLVSGKRVPDRCPLLALVGHYHYPQRLVKHSMTGATLHISRL
jgi:hypothetical protein